MVQSDLISGWGETGTQDFSTDKLQETEVPIVPSSKCVERMADAEDVVESLIVCTEGAGTETGPCKVIVACYLHMLLHPAKIDKDFRQAGGRTIPRQGWLLFPLLWDASAPSRH